MCCMGTPQKVSNFAELMHKVARSCFLQPLARKFTNGESLGVTYCSSDEYDAADRVMDEEVSSDLTADINNDDSRNESVEVYPLESSEYENLLQRMHAMETVIAEMFDSISSLKTAYVRLQEAHSPYEPERLYQADKAVVAQIRKLSDLKQSYRRSHEISHSSFSRKIQDMDDKRLQEVYEGVVKDLRSELKEKNAEIESLKQNLRGSNTKKKDKADRPPLKRHASSTRDYHIVVSGCAAFESPNPQLFQSSMLDVRAAAKNFTALLTSLMKDAKWDIPAAVNSIEPGVKYPKQSHMKYALESYVCQKMFTGFENETFYMSGSLSSLLEPDKHRRGCFSQFRDMHLMEPMELLNILPDCPFGKFCNKKFLRIVHPKMEEAFFGNFDHRTNVVNGRHPPSYFYEMFCRLAKAVWLLHKLAFSFNPVPSHFHVKRGTAFQPSYMESIVPVEELEDINGGHLVAFAVTPGFKIGDSVIKSRVYLQARKINSAD